MNTRSQRLNSRTTGPNFPNNYFRFNWVSVFLFSYQTEYKKTLTQLKRIQQKIDQTTLTMDELNKIGKVFQGSEFQQKYEDLVKEYSASIDIDALKQECRHMRAVSLKMKKVLENTNAEQQTKFQCFVCMDRYVDIFFDPCGHVMCSACWNRSQRASCPACRQQARPKRIYTMN